MTFDDIVSAIDAAKNDNARVDNNVHKIAQLIAGRLRAAGSPDWRTADAFRALKKELASFDSRTGCWKE
jgi:hypothetical protein